MCKQSLVALVSLLSFTSAPAVALVFEDTGQTADRWDLLDMAGDAEVSVLADPTCPPGFGPQTLHIQGGRVLLLAKGARLGDGTIMVLYHELSPRVNDADGVILFRGQYGEDVGVEHNTKVERPHYWLEEDNDAGIQFRFVDGEGNEQTLVEHAGQGLVTDPWNRTGWIWQKVQLQGPHMRAKFWPAELPEPADWAIETEDRAVLQGRFGIHVSSGEIALAYYGADTTDLRREAPTVYLFTPQPRVTQAERIPVDLFTNYAAARQESFTLTAKSGETVLGTGVIQRNIPAGSATTPLVLATTEAAGDGKQVLKLDREPAPGPLRVELTGDNGQLAASLSLEMLSVEGLRQRFAAVNVAVQALSQALEQTPPDDPRTRALTVVRDAAKAHYDYAHERFLDSYLGESDPLRYAVEALDELKGYKGGWLSALAPGTTIPAIPPASAAPSTASVTSKVGILDLYSAAYGLRFGAVKMEAQSFVMGHRYAVTIPWTVEGAAPDRDLAFSVRLMSPLGNRIVAQSDAVAAIPVTQWTPSHVYQHQVSLQILPEDPSDGTKQLREAPVLDEYHYLVLSVTDPKTGASLLLNNEPGRQPDRVGAGYAATEVYVSSSPIEIRGFAPAASCGTKPRTDSATVHNAGESPQKVEALFSAKTETGRVLHQALREINLQPGAEESIQLEWTPKAVGPVTLEWRVLRENVVLTEAKRDLVLTDPAGAVPTLVKLNSVTQRGGSFVTSLTLDAGPIDAKPTTVTVAAEGRSVGSAQGPGPIVAVEAEPWFGYYDIHADLGGFSYDRRIVATVVETRGTDLLVNGEPFILKGVNVHGMDPASPERTASMMRVMRDLGFNTWRGDYPARWQVDLAYQLNSVYTVLAPFSCASTPEIFARQDGPPLTTGREITRLFVERYSDSAGVLLWNSCNEIVGDNVDFLLSMYPLYKEWDPYARPVHYANLYGQDLWQGQDAMGVNYYFARGQSAADRQPLVQHSIELAQAHHLPVLYTEFNSYFGPVHSTGAEAMRDLFAWGVEQGMCGGFQYMKGDSEDHPGVFDSGYNTRRIYDDAIRAAFADATVSIVEVTAAHATLRIANKRRCTLRQMQLTLKTSGVAQPTQALADIAPQDSAEVVIPVPASLPGDALTLAGRLEFVTHFGFHSQVPLFLAVPRP